MRRMARGQTTEEDLRTGLQGVGAFDALRVSPGLKRENLFATAPRALRPARPPPPEPHVEVETPLERPPTKAGAAPRQGETAPVIPEHPPEKGRAQREVLLTDPVTVPMTAEMRSKASLLAAELQRRRTEKSERITPNTVFRVAIQLFLETFDLGDAGPINSAEDLLERGRGLLRKTKKEAPRGPTSRKSTPNLAHGIPTKE